MTVQNSLKILRHKSHMSSQRPLKLVHFEASKSLRHTSHVDFHKSLRFTVTKRPRNDPPLIAPLISHAEPCKRALKRLHNLQMHSSIHL